MAMRWLAASAPVSKYSHHIASCRRTTSANRTISGVHGSSANVAPVTSSDSPSAMMTNSAHRSAMCPPSMSQSWSSNDRGPAPRSRQPRRRRLHASASAHQQRVSPSANAPTIQNTPRRTSQTRMRWKFRGSVRRRRAPPTGRTACAPPACTRTRRRRQPALAEAPTGSMPTASPGEHQHEEGDAHRHAFGIEPVGDPRRVDPHPPDGQQQQRHLHRAQHAQVSEQRCDSCVTANTNTRSKNSSTMPTRAVWSGPR